MDSQQLTTAIAILVEEYERLHACEVSSLWVEHYMGRTPSVEITITTRARIKAA